MRNSGAISTGFETYEVSTICIWRGLFEDTERCFPLPPLADEDAPLLLVPELLDFAILEKKDDIVMFQVIVESFSLSVLSIPGGWVQE